MFKTLGSLSGMGKKEKEKIQTGPQTKQKNLYPRRIYGLVKEDMHKPI